MLYLKSNGSTILFNRDINWVFIGQIPMKNLRSKIDFYFDNINLEEFKESWKEIKESSISNGYDINIILDSQPMKKHTKIYLEAFGYTDTDFIPCEICDQKAVDIHHLENRGMGGSTQKDDPENLMALCRECHVTFGDKTKFKKMLNFMHTYFMHLKRI